MSSPASLNHIADSVWFCPLMICHRTPGHKQQEMTNNVCILYMLWAFDGNCKQIQRAKFGVQKFSSHHVAVAHLPFMSRGMNPRQEEMSRTQSPGAINTDELLWIDIIHCVYYNSHRTWFCILALPISTAHSLWLLVHSFAQSISHQGAAHDAILQSHRELLPIRDATTEPLKSPVSITYNIVVQINNPPLFTWCCNARIHPRHCICRYCRYWISVFLAKHHLHHFKESHQHFNLGVAGI